MSRTFAPKCCFCCLEDFWKGYCCVKSPAFKFWKDSASASEWLVNKHSSVSKMCSGRHRWVIYTTEMNGKNTLWEVDGSMVPAEWYLSCSQFVMSTINSKFIYIIVYNYFFKNNFDQNEMKKTESVFNATGTFLVFNPQASLAALYNGRSPHHTSTRAQEVPGWGPPVQREWQPSAVRALPHHPQEDPRVGPTESRSSVNSDHVFVNYGFLLLYPARPE